MSLPAKRRARRVPGAPLPCFAERRRFAGTVHRCLPAASDAGALTRPQPLERQRGRVRAARPALRLPANAPPGWAARLSLSKESF